MLCIIQTPKPLLPQHINQASLSLLVLTITLTAFDMIHFVGLPNDVHAFIVMREAFIGFFLSEFSTPKTADARVHSNTAPTKIIKNLTGKTASAPVRL